MKNKSVTGFKWLRLAGALGLLFISIAARADAETGDFNVWSTGSGSTNPNYFYIQNKTLPAAGTGTARCGFGLVATPLNSEGNKAMYSMALAANLAGKNVTINYTYSTSLFSNCTATSVTLN